MINWGLLGNAMLFYKNKGYNQIDVPWITQNVINMITTDDERNLVKLAGTVSSLVGSAEQSFLAMQFNGNLPKGKYVSCTPCFRYGVLDEFHQQYFMKVELYQTDSTDMNTMYSMIDDAEEFFSTVYHGTRRPDEKSTLKRVATMQGIDIELNGIEIGSYGNRSFSSHKWLYGTGLALPRFSQAARNIQKTTGQ